MLFTLIFYRILISRYEEFHCLPIIKETISNVIVISTF